MGFGYVLFRFSKSSGIRSLCLSLMMISSASVWTFALSSLAFCVMLIKDYWKSPLQAISLASELALCFTFIVSPVAILLLKKRASKEIYPFFSSIESELKSGSQTFETNSLKRVTGLYSAIRGKIPSLAKVELKIIPRGPKADLPISVALDWKGERVVAVSEDVTSLLDDEELESVIAHELGHIKHRDSALKTIATSYKFAFPFDPLSRLIEAAIYRERELGADEFSAKSTGNPAALASALIKIHEKSGDRSIILRSHAISSSSMSMLSSVNGGGHVSFLSKQPSLALRVRRLLDMAGRMNLRTSASGST